MKRLLKIALLISMIILTACVKNNLDGTDNNLVTDGPMEGMNVSDDFSYKTIKQVTVNLSVPDFLKKAVFHLYSKTGTSDSLSIGKAIFNNNGVFSREITVSAATDSILIYSQYIGLTKDIRLAITGDELSFDYNTLYSAAIGGKAIAGNDSYRDPQGFFTYLSHYNANGVPNSITTRDNISTSLLEDINNSLPEYIGVPTVHPEYLADKETEIILTQQANVYLTFVAEGADFKNSIGFYTYTLGQEPTSASSINVHYIAVPNASMHGSGGKMVPGDKIPLGNYPANTVISWFLVANGWDGSAVKENAQRYYANPAFNPETNASKKDHMVLLHDASRGINIFGFEDLNRENGGSDDDFNDAVFYVSSNPVNAISTTNVAVLDPAQDVDGDNIGDQLDEFPNDATKAFNNYYPSENGYGTVVFEDLWPSTGDYDFNDLVANYNFNLITNGSNLVTTIKATYTISHIGGSFHNGLAFVLPINPNKVSGITGQVLNGSYITTKANGTEESTSTNETVVFVCADAMNLTGQTITLTITLNTPVAIDALGVVPYNTFIVVNGEREREVHLPDLPPTSKGADLGTGDDYSDATKGKYYKTSKNLPWGLNIYDAFIPPSEKTPITTRYPKFKTWANSGGTVDQLWYEE